MIIDFHTHIFPPEICNRREHFSKRDAWFTELYGNPKARMATADDLVASMEKAGVDISVTFPFGWSDSGIIAECNSYIIDAMKRFPDKITGLAAIQPMDEKNSLREIERCAQAGMPGFGELMPHGQGYHLSDIELLQPVVEAAQSLNMFMLTHMSEPIGHTYPGKGDVSLADLAAFIEAFPNMKVIAAHWGGGFPFYELMPEVKASALNVWYDTAATQYLYQPDIFPNTVSLVGAQKILFGSDYPLLSQGATIKHIQNSGISNEDARSILGSNASKILGL